MQLVQGCGRMIWRNEPAWCVLGSSIKYLFDPPERKPTPTVTCGSRVICDDCAANAGITW